MRKYQQALAGLECLVVEPDSPADLPTVLGLHGRGSSAEEMAAVLGRLSAGRFRLVLPNGPLPVVNAPWQDGFAWYVVGREQPASIARARDLVLDLATVIQQRHDARREQLAIVGFSQGAVVGLDAGLRSPEPFGGVAVLSGYLYAPETLGAALRDAHDRRILLLHGSYDEIIPVDGGRLARDVLEAAGLEPEYHELPLRHTLNQRALVLVRDFLERALRPVTAGGAPR